MLTKIINHDKNGNLHYRQSQGYDPTKLKECGVLDGISILKNIEDAIKDDIIIVDGLYHQRLYTRYFKEAMKDKNKNNYIEVGSIDEKKIYRKFTKKEARNMVHNKLIKKIEDIDYLTSHFTKYHKELS